MRYRSSVKNAPFSFNEFSDELSGRESPEYIRWVQQSLNRVLGLNLAADGVAGPQTRSAIRGFQGKSGLTADGIVGPMTEAALLRAGAGSPPSTATPLPVPSPSPSAPDIVTVRGFKVARAIAPNIESLVTAAEADGILLGGWGYRSTATQIELRKKHCGTSQYDIYQKPSMQCTPPTAPPGKSMHEKGLAIDFTYQGKTINSRNSPAFQWLQANAERFGMQNFPPEPWHWSVNGH